MTERPSRLKCLPCGILLHDTEPAAPHGAYYHPRTDQDSRVSPACANAGRYLRLGDGEGDRGVAPALDKRTARARARGARLASKHRPRSGP